jgi:hypothetical protein
MASGLPGAGVAGHPSMSWCDIERRGPGVSPGGFAAGPVPGMASGLPGAGVAGHPSMSWCDIERRGAGVSPGRFAAGPGPGMASGLPSVLVHILPAKIALEPVPTCPPMDRP